MRHGWLCALLTAACAPAIQAQSTRGAVVREFPFPVPPVKAALENIGAYSGSRLPSLEGFANLDRVNVKDYQRPYYEFRILLDPRGPHQTTVQVKANVSAWYTGPDAPQPGYRAVESNGRLENDLLDRLGEYLRDKSADSATLEQWIAAARQERADTDRHTDELQQEMRKRENPPSQDVRYVTVERPHVMVRIAPDDTAAVRVKAQIDDEFQALEHRGAWLRVKLDGAGDGWVRAGQVVDSDVEASTATGKEPAFVAGFEVIRENTAQFSGEWPHLKGKRALYLWVRPDGAAMNLPTASRLQFVQRVFRERYRQISHSSRDSVEGIVVIFMDQRGGVAAAGLDDIRHWVEGSLSQSAFLKKCSLDPPGAFQESPAKQHAQQSSSASHPRA